LLLAVPCALTHPLAVSNPARHRLDAEDRQQLAGDDPGAKSEEHPDSQAVAVLGLRWGRGQGNVVGAEDEGGYAAPPGECMHELRPGKPRGGGRLAKGCGSEHP